MHGLGLPVDLYRIFEAISMRSSNPILKQYNIEYNEIRTLQSVGAKIWENVDIVLSPNKDCGHLPYLVVTSIMSIVDKFNKYKWEPTRIQEYLCL